MTICNNTRRGGGGANEQNEEKKVLVRKLEGKRPPRRPRRAYKIILKWMLKGSKEVCRASSYDNGGRQTSGPCECNTEPSSSIKCWEFLY
jgi:hypothetical protein